MRGINKKMKEYKLESNNVYFHKEAHVYFDLKENYERFSKSYIKNKEWALRNKKKWDPVPSVTQILSDWKSFTGGDLKITKSWFVKEATYNKEKDDWIDKTTKTLESVEEYLKRAVKKTQTEGTIAHTLVQDFILNYVNTGKGAFSTKEINPYFQSFINELRTSGNTELRNIIKNIEIILPAEKAVIGKLDTNIIQKGNLYAGQWDLLVKTKNKEVILIDIKTGSNVHYDKEESVGLQLNAYDNLIKQSLNINVDNLLCWELSYKIPFKELTKKLTSEKKKSVIEPETIIHLEQELKKLENNKGKREYFWKSHQYEKNNDFIEIAKLVYELNIIRKKVKDSIKLKHRLERIKTKEN